jgi:hypothetical protein
LRKAVGGERLRRLRDPISSAKLIGDIATDSIKEGQRWIERGSRERQGILARRTVAGGCWRCGRESIEIHRSLSTASRLFISEIDPLAKQGGYQHQCVRDDKHPIRQQPGIDDEAGRRRKLPDEEPSGHAPRGAPSPLRVDLTPDCHEEDDGRDPANQLS